MSAANVLVLPSHPHLPVTYSAKVNSALHEKVKAAKPNQPNKPTTFWVAILHERKLPAEADGEVDFLWIKCHGVSRLDIKSPRVIQILTFNHFAENYGRGYQ